MRRIINLVTLLICIPLYLTGCNPGDNQKPADEDTIPRRGELIVFAAASLTEAITSIADGFKEEYPGIDLIFNFAGSQQLAQQLAQGAPADIFLSANQLQADAVIKVGRADASKVVPFAENDLVVIVPKDNRAQVTDLQDLEKPGLKLILADPQVPVGAYTMEFLESASRDERYGESFQQALLDNVVSYEENVRAVLSKVILGEGDAGVVYRSDALQAGADQVGMIPIPEEINPTARYFLVPIQNSQQPEIARQFADFILSKQGQEILANYGLGSIH